MSANPWLREFLKDEYGVEADEMEWLETNKSSDIVKLSGFGWSAFESGVDSPSFLFNDFTLRRGPPDVDESDSLVMGQCDALITAITPAAFLEGKPKIGRLFRDVKATEHHYFWKTGFFPSCTSSASGRLL